MRRKLSVALAAVLMAVLSACGGTAGGNGTDVVTLYTADGLEDWYAQRFGEFTARTGITVQVVTAGSGEVTSRVEKERANPQADVLVTLPPFIQRAASQNLLTGSGYAPMINNYLCFIATTGQPAPRTWDDLLDPKYRGKLQYSTPGEAGDGTAVLLQLQHVFGKQGALDYLARLQANNVGPSSSTGKLQPKVAKGELLVANGDVQMNLAEIEASGGFEVFFPADATGTRSTFALPYYAGQVAGGPHPDNARKLVDFLFSPQVQATAVDAYGLPGRADVAVSGPKADRIKAVLQGVEIWQPDWNAVLAGLDADLDAYRKAVGR
ncbi:2-aminoethylphosphonate ABC transporter substrate-binding protein [Amycolatopsis thermalba]|uniref:2-aminoethylphosphonate ABC transporter substrate-binding protein n=1 Tax=Amycolatopsis thermalba TaxID=944492 RepID=A0ABY4NUZ3_9PSEU|nr:2-aminoethylphosphonate ABC transporter substrate-binding protein [Amycolatopsis thermalba]UQS23873.1 2-aminoethylphosphonate ABC transporter substrate-binding protein [Amycolatopsis thermalba]